MAYKLSRKKNRTKHIKEIKTPKWCKRKPFLTSPCMALRVQIFQRSPTGRKRRPQHLFFWWMGLVSSLLLASSVKQIEVKPVCPFLKSWFEVGKEKNQHICENKTFEYPCWASSTPCPGSVPQLCLVGDFWLAWLFCWVWLRTLSGVSPLISTACNAWAKQPHKSSDSNCSVSQVKIKQINRKF